MPASSTYLLTPVMSFIGWLNPSSILDVGCGYGSWGLLLRQHLEAPWELINGRPLWHRRIEGIEAWSDYRNALWSYAYDRVVVAEAATYLETVRDDSFGLALCLEVLEHLTPAAGTDLVSELRRVATHVVLTTPDRPMTQGELCRNPFEEHKSWWSWRALHREGAMARLPASGSTVALFSKEPEALRPWLQGLRLRSLGPISSPSLRLAGQRLLRWARLHPGAPENDGGGPSLEYRK
jgi:hypothetical protein